jgi:RNA polymerase sigma factor (sigma-70 family)
VRAAAAGDPGAWHELVERYGGLVWAVTRAHRLSGADAADVVQTTWLRLVEHLERLKTPAAVGGWLATTARRECLHVLRQAARCQPRDAVPEPVAEESADAGAPLLIAERDATVRQAFSRLPARDRALLGLLTAEPRPSYDEIGSTLGMPIGSIGPTRARALERLRRQVEDLGLDALGAVA